MRFLKPLLMSCVLIWSSAAFAQKSYHAPENPKMDSAKDYMPYKQDILDATAYLKSLPQGKESANRKAVSAFVTKWIIGSPDVSIVMMSNLMKPLKSEGDLLLLYMAGWACYGLETGDYSKYPGNAAGARTVVEYYKNPANKVARNKKLDVWVKKYDEGNLDAYVTGLMTAEENGQPVRD